MKNTLIQTKNFLASSKIPWLYKEKLLLKTYSLHNTWLMILITRNQNLIRTLYLAWSRTTVEPIVRDPNIRDWETIVVMNGCKEFWVIKEATIQINWEIRLVRVIKYHMIPKIALNLINLQTSTKHLTCPRRFLKSQNLIEWWKLKTTLMQCTLRNSKKYISLNLFFLKILIMLISKTKFSSRTLWNASSYNVNHKIFFKALIPLVQVQVVKYFQTMVHSK
jgi:hypothetical protein